VHDNLLKECTMTTHKLSNGGTSAAANESKGYD